MTQSASDLGGWRLQAMSLLLNVRVSHLFGSTEGADGVRDYSPGPCKHMGFLKVDSFQRFCCVYCDDVCIFLSLRKNKGTENPAGNLSLPTTV